MKLSQLNRKYHRRIMNSLISAVLGVLCALVSTSNAVSEEDLDIQLMHMECPPGQRPAKLDLFCPKAARDVLDCRHLRVGCVQQSFGNDHGSSHADEWGPAPPPKTEEEIEQEMLHKECPFGKIPTRVARCPPWVRDSRDCWPDKVDCIQQSFRDETWERGPILSSSGRAPKGEEQLEQEFTQATCPRGQRPAKVSPLCPTGAKDTLDCPPTEVACVKLSFGNDPGTTESTLTGPPQAHKTEEELDQEFVNKECIFGQRPAKISPKCPTGARDNAECPPVEIWCVKLSFGNDPGSKSEISGPVGTPKTDDELELEMMHMVCAHGQKPTLIQGICPTGARDTVECSHTRVACRQRPFGNDQPTTTEKSLARIHEENRWAIEHPNTLVNKKNEFGRLRNPFRSGTYGR